MDSNTSHHPKDKPGEALRGLTMFGAGIGRLRDYGLALLLVAIGVMMRMVLTRLAGPGMPTYISFFPFVMLAALIGGWGPGLLATLATAVVVGYWLLPPSGSFKIGSTPDAVGLVFFCVMGIFVSIVAELYRRTRDHLDELVVVRTMALGQANERLSRQAQELMAANVALRKSEKRLGLALQSARMGRWEWDLRTDSLSWCKRIYELLGLDTSRKAGMKTFLDCVHSDDREAVKRLLTDAVKNQKDLEIEFRVLRHRQEPRSEIAWLAFHATVMRDEQRQAVRMIGVLYDITRRKQLEQKLRRLNNLLGGEVQAQTEELKDSENRLQAEVVRRASVEGELRERSQMLEAFFQHTITPLAFLDRDFRLLRVNEAYAKADNKSPDYFVGKNHFDLYPHEENQAIFEQVVRSGQPYYAYAKPFTYPDQPERGVTYWDWQLTPLCDALGQVQFLVFSLEDVTERQRAFAEVEHRARQLRKLTLDLSQAEERERKRLAEILHDDLQQVLAAAKFHLGVLQGRVKTDAALQELTTQTRDLLKEAIDKSRSLSHELSSPALHSSDLSEAFEWLAQQMQSKHGLVIHLAVRGRIELPSEHLRVLLYKTAQELLFNVVKHAHVNEVAVRVRECRQCVCLSVSDRGRGFDPQELPHAAGFGLLSIRERIELLGGRMKIKSAKGKGSTFFIVVPVPRNQGVAPQIPSFSSHTVR